MSKFRTFIKNHNDFTKGQLKQLLLTNFVVVFITFLMIVLSIGFILEDLLGFDVKNNFDIVCIIAAIVGSLLSLLGDYIIYKKYTITCEEKDDIIDISDVEL